MASNRLRYWDSCCFVAWLASEPDRVDECRGVIKKAEAGDLRIVTSSIALTEVIKLKSHAPMTRDKEQMIRDFFKHDYIVVRQVTRFVAEHARQLVWDHGFQPKDSIHVATCDLAKIPRLDTFDDKLIAKSGLIGSPPITIGHPDEDEQLDLGLDDPFDGDEDVDGEA